MVSNGFGLDDEDDDEVEGVALVGDDLTPATFIFGRPPASVFIVGGAALWNAVHISMTQQSEFVVGPPDTEGSTYLMITSHNKAIEAADIARSA